MKKRNTAAIIIAIAVVMIGAILPRGASAIQDRIQSIKTEIAPINEIQLSSQNINFLKKLYLYAKGGSSVVYVTEENTTRTQEEIKTLFFQQLESYISSGLIDQEITQSSYSIVACKPYMIATMDSPAVANTVWAIELTDTEAYRTYLSVNMDDQTGKLLSIQYICDEYSYDGTNREQAITMLASFIEIYAGNLDLSVPEIMDTEHLVVYKDNGVSNICQWEDDVYGEITATFEVAPSGFYIHFCIYGTG